MPTATDDLMHDLALVAVGRVEILVEGRAIVAIRDGRVDAAELEGGALGHRINKLDTHLRALAKTNEIEGAQIYVFFDRATPFETVFKVVGTVSKASFTKPLLLVASADGELRSLPLKIPDSRMQGAVFDPGFDPAQTSGDERLELVVSVTKERGVVLWSATGLEGTLVEPKLNQGGTPGDGIDLGPLRTALLEIVRRRWQGKRRPDSTKEVIVQLDPELSFQVAANVIASVRIAEDGTELFPDVLLSSGFQ